MTKCIFCQIRDKDISKDFIYENKDVMVFEDINPIKPIHLLIVSKEHISDFLLLSDKNLISSLTDVVKKMIKQHFISQKGYRIGINGGGAQAVDHLHIHLIGPIGKSDEM